jgi:hypothetical protein
MYPSVYMHAKWGFLSDCIGQASDLRFRAKLEVTWNLATKGRPIMKLVINIVRRADVYEAWCPALPGCRVSDVSKEQACDRIRSAVSGYLSSLDVALPRELGTMLSLQGSSA